MVQYRHLVNDDTYEHYTVVKYCPSRMDTHTPSPIQAS